MARPSKYDGVVYRRPDSKLWWMRYRDRSGQRRLESPDTEDWNEAQRVLRERLAARDNNTLETIRKERHLRLTNGRIFFWRIIPNHRFVRKTPTRPIKQPSKVLFHYDPDKPLTLIPQPKGTKGN